MRERFHASALEIGGIFAVLSITQVRTTRIETIPVSRSNRNQPTAHHTHTANPQSIVSPFIAAISRRLGRANTLRLGILLSIVGGFIFSVDRVWAFFLARALQVGR